jgi:MFS transporter, ACS family, D-galactonate transporter
LKRDGVVTVSLVIFCQSFQGLTFGGIALFMPLIRQDLHMSFAQGGMLSAAATFTYALGQIPAGYLSDRFGPKRLFFIGVLGSTLLSLNFGLLESFEWAVANQVVSGVFRTLLFAPGLTLVASWFPPNRRATAMGLYIIGGFSGNILLSLVGPLMVNHYGWRVPFLVFSALGICAAFVYLAFGKEKPATGPKQPVGMLELFQLVRYPIMWVCAGIQFIRLGVVTSFNFWLPSLLVADRGLSLQTAGFITAMGAALTMPSNGLGGYVSDRLKNPPLVIGGSLAVLACTSLLLVTVQSIPLLVCVVAVNSIFVQFYFGPLFYVPVEVLGQRMAGMSTGFSNMFANLGALFFAYALGVVKDRAGAFTWGFVGTSVACLLGLVLTVVLARMRRRALAAKGH